MHSCHIKQVRCHGGRVSRKCRTGDIPLPRSLTRYARSFGCGERGKHAREWKLHYPQIQGRSGRRTCAQEERPGERIPALPVFHRLRPLTSITESDAQISGGETRQDLKIPGVSPWWLPRALSCSCLSVYRCHSAVMAAFISFHA